MLGSKRGQRLGVLFVHGIGEQTESENVRWFAGSLIDWAWLLAAAYGLFGYVLSTRRAEGSPPS